jgi:hypothetical protein
LKIAFTIADRLKRPDEKAASRQRRRRDARTVPLLTAAIGLTEIRNYMKSQ